MVDVAQLVEHPVVVRDVAGSSPVVHPNFFSYSGVTISTIESSGNDL